MAVASRPLAGTHSSTRGERQDRTGLALQLLAYIVLVGVALAMLIPFLFSISTSVKTNQEANTINFGNIFIPSNPTLAAYTTVWEANIGRWFFNSAVVAAVWVLARAVFDSMAGYAFARMRFPGKNLIFLMVLSTLMVPGMVTLIPKFLILDRLGLLNSYGALTLPFLTSAFGIFLMKQFFESIPIELEEAARVDGASRYRMFVQIILPNAMPALTALAIFSFQGSWNNFLEPLVYISSAELFTLPIGLAFFRQANYTDWPAVMAAAVITTVPIAMFYLFFQRYFVEGVSTSGIKG
ncbi:MAG: carbohydrate ABC transporter permease [Chloroflexota bacterium]|nr:carbohydrate ABC transporter permease [Chloroflexota bacterium]